MYIVQYPIGYIAVKDIRFRPWQWLYVDTVVCCSGITWSFVLMSYPKKYLVMHVGIVVRPWAY